MISFFPQKNWEARYITIIKNAVAVVVGSGQITLEMFITDRDYVAKVMGWEINQRLQPVYGYATAVYLREIGMGSTGFSSIDNVYLNKQISIRRAVTSAVVGETQVLLYEKLLQQSSCRIHRKCKCTCEGRAKAEAVVLIYFS